MTTTAKVGAETDAFCTKCELLLAHTILAMVGPKIARVRCETCKAEHAYRGAVVPAGAKKPRAARVPAAQKVVIAWEERLKNNDLTKARKYSPKESFAPDEVINHPTFGYGIVSAVRGDKIDVAFKTFEKTLLCKRPDGLASRPTFGTKASAVPQPNPEDGQSIERPDSTPDEGSGTVAS